MRRHWRGVVAAVCMLASWAPGSVEAQVPLRGPLPSKPLFAPHPEMDDGGYGAVSFLDSPMPYSHLRVRYDVNHDLIRPTRGEVFWAKPGPHGPGVPLPERSVDWNDLDLYWEHACFQRLSVFVGAPLRYLRPEVNARESGFYDLQAGFKLAVVMRPDLIISAQVKGHFPTGDSEQGLGRDFFAIEPGLLLESPLHQWVVLNAQADYFLPLDGTDFAGEYIRYGLGLTFGDQKDPSWWITPVAEVMAWTFISGKEQIVSDVGAVSVQNIRNETIVNAYLGVRFHLSERCDIYGGFGRAISNDTWARDMGRLEFRLAF